MDQEIDNSPQSSNVGEEYTNALQQDDEEASEEMDSTAADQDDADMFNPYLFIASLPAYSLVGIKDKICLPPSATKNKISLVLDLDETLVHCTVDPIPNPDLIFPVS